MGRMRALLRRHGLTLGLTTALVVVVWGAALPAVEERAQVRAQREATDRELDLRQRELNRAELWLSGLREGDGQVRARLAQERLRSPEVEGPVFVADQR
jgi:hypothetical protein